MFNIESWCGDNGIQFRHTNAKNITWDCPFCHKGAGHFTVHIQKGVYNCYRCGNSGYFPEIIAQVKGVGLQEASDIYYSLTLFTEGYGETDERTVDRIGPAICATC